MKNTIKTSFIALALILIGSFSVPTSTFATLPTVLTIQANPVSQNSATLHASFDANGASDIDVRFEYGTTPLFGNTTSYVNYTTETGTHQASITVSAGTTYYFRAMAVADGPGYGTTLSFTTPSFSIPSMLTTTATNISGTSATLNGFYNSNNGGTITTWFQYANNSSFVGATTTSQTSQINNSGSFSLNISGLTENTTYYFRAIGQNSGGSTLGQPVLSFTTGEENGGDPIDDCQIDYFYASPDQVDEGDDSTLYWNTTNCDTVYLSGDGISGYYGVDDNVDTDNLYNDETFTITASGNGNTDTASETIYVDDNNNGNNNNNDCEITEFDISPNNVSFGGYVTISWETDDCDDVEIVGGNINDDFGNDGDITAGPIYNNTTFYIYADGNDGSDSDHETVTVGNYNNNQNSDCSDGVDNDGDGYTDMNDGGCSSVSDDNEYNMTYISYQNTAPTYTYNTPSNTITKTVYANTVSGGNNLLSLTVETNGNEICRRDMYQATVTYKNVSGGDLKDVVLKINLPKNIDYRSSSSGIYSKSNNAIIVNVESIKKGNEGVVYVFGDVTGGIMKERIAVTEAIATFKNPKNGISEDAIAYKVQDANLCGSALAGLALFGGDFFPNTFMGWLILILAIAGLLILAKELYGAGNKHQTAH